MNGFGIELYSLIDTGVNGYLFLNRPLAIYLLRALGTPIHKLPYSVPIHGFSNEIGAKVTHYIRLYLTVDGHRVYNYPFMVLDLGSQDMIIGLKWMKYFKLGIDTNKNCFKWPAEYPPTPS